MPFTMIYMIARDRNLETGVTKAEDLPGWFWKISDVSGHNGHGTEQIVFLKQRIRLMRWIQKRRSIAAVNGVSSPYK